MQHTSFNNIFTRIFEPKNYKLTFQGLPLHINCMFQNPNDLYKEAILAEVSLFSDSGSRNLRTIFAEDKNFKFLSQRFSNVNQASMLFPTIYLAFIIASNVELRSLFNDQVKSDHQIPEFVNRIFKYVRATKSPSLTISFSNSASNLIDTYGWQGKILDPNHLIANSESRSAAFNLLCGSYFVHVYKGIKFTNYEPVSFDTQMSTVSSIKTNFTDSIYKLKVYNFSSVKQLNSMFDPTLTESATAFFGGCVLTDKFGNVPETGPCNTVFRIDTNTSNYFNSLFSFYLMSEGTTYTNPSTSDESEISSNISDDNSNSSKPKIRANKKNLKAPRDAMKLEQQILQFANNLYEAGLTSYFTQFVRNNKLHKLSHNN